MCTLFWSKTIAQDVITLGVNDSVSYTLKNYTGKATNVTVIIPKGYTNPEFAKAKGIDLSVIPATITDLTIQSDGSTKDTLLMKVFTLPTRLLNSFTVKNLYLSGVNELTSGTNYTNLMGNYFINATTAINVTNLSVVGCHIANYRGIIRMQSGVPTITNVSFDKCVIRNIGYAGGSYSFVNPASGSVSTISLTNSYVYSFNGTFLPLSVIATSNTTVTIDKCVFDQMGLGKTGLYLIDYGSTAVSTGSQTVSITNSIFGRAYISAGVGSKGVRLSNASSTPTYSGNYATRDWYASVLSNKFTVSAYLKNAVAADTGYVANLFKNPTTYDATNYTSTVGDYSIIDATFAGATPNAVHNPIATTSIKFNGSEIMLSETADIKVYSINGFLLKSAKQVNQLSVANLKKGVYIVKAGTAVQKFAVK